MQKIQTLSETVLMEWIPQELNPHGNFFFIIFFQASMLSQPDGPFINIAKLNLSKYAQRQNLAKVWYTHQHIAFKKENK